MSSFCVKLKCPQLEKRDIVDQFITLILAYNSLQNNLLMGERERASLSPSLKKCWARAQVEAKPRRGRRGAGAASPDTPKSLFIESLLNNKLALMLFLKSPLALASKDDNDSVDTFFEFLFRIILPLTL